jgi:hypothetical protein
MGEWNGMMGDPMDAPRNITERIQRLPAWAREHIEDLLRERKAAERRTQQLEEERSIQVSANNRKDNDGPRVTWEYLMEGEHALPKYANVRFHIDRERGMYITLRWNERDQMIDVNGSYPLVINPVASNSVYITTKERN